MLKIKEFYQEHQKTVLIVVGVLLTYFIYTKIKNNGTKR